MRRSRHATFCAPPVASLLTALAFFLGAGVANGQSGYIAGSLNADIVRNGGIDDRDATGTGEATSFSLRAGAPFASTFGVEVDFTRPGEIETDETPDVRILADVISALTGDVGLTSLTTFPALDYRIHTVQRTTTITTAAWARQELSPRVSLVYLGGIAFARTESTVSTTLNYVVPLPLIYPPSFDNRTVNYTAGPMVGFDARIGLTEHVQLVPGVRLMSPRSGWIIRPGIALGWQF